MNSTGQNNVNFLGITQTLRKDEIGILYITKTLIKTRRRNEMKLKGTAFTPPLLLSIGLDKSGVQFFWLQQAAFPCLTKELQSASQEKL